MFADADDDAAAQARCRYDTGSNEGHMPPRVAHKLKRAVTSQWSRFSSNGSSSGFTLGVTFADRVELGAKPLTPSVR